jgi:hypothetical protein
MFYEVWETIRGIKNSPIIFKEKLFPKRLSAITNDSKKNYYTAMVALYKAMENPVKASYAVIKHGVKDGSKAVAFGNTDINKSEVYLRNRVGGLDHYEIKNFRKLMLNRYLYHVDSIKEEHGEDNG